MSQTPKTLTAEQIAAALAEPFNPEEVEWKPQSIKGERALAVPYADARVVMDRLDSVLGVGNWQTSYREIKDGIVCQLQARIGEQWFEHEDVGSFSDQPDGGDRTKSAFSDSLKRAAVHLGVGRYLYHLPPQWLDYDPQRKQFKAKPKLPSWALPGQDKRQPAPQAMPAKDANGSAPKPRALPASGEELENRLADYDQDLAEEGLFMQGDLLGHVLEVVAKAGPKPGVTYGTDCRTWPERAIKLAVEAAKAFEADARAKAQRKQATLDRIAGKE